MRIRLRRGEKLVRDPQGWRRGLRAQLREVRAAAGSRALGARDENRIWDCGVLSGDLVAVWADGPPPGHVPGPVTLPRRVCTDCWAHGPPEGSLFCVDLSLGVEEASEHSCHM